MVKAKKHPKPCRAGASVSTSASTSGASNQEMAAEIQALKQQIAKMSGKWKISRNKFPN
jgi:predicted FMN-binding regulatory protein PaiB